MRFALSREQQEFAASLRELLSAAEVPLVARAWADGDPAPGRKLWARLAESGVTALGLGDDDGGFGATAVDLVVAFRELGRAAVPGPWVESVAVVPTLLAGTGRSAALAAIGSGEMMASVALPPLVPYALDGGYADLVLAADGARVSEARVVGQLASVDRARRLARVGAAEPIPAECDVDKAFDTGALAVAAQLHGLGSALLDRAVAYAKQRVQFGRPIGEFQAVKHQLADAMVGLDLARPLLFGAALSCDAADTAVRARDVSAAKVAAADAAYRAARTSLQVHGAIGYTAEYDLSLWLTKARALRTAWGAPSD
jgi:alkylation response protein AidB-like acyl-CoA dehydrogenase